MSTLKINGLSKSFGAETAVDAVDLQVEQGALFCLLGPSGCGKTTLLRLIGGYYDADAGNIALAGANITHLPPEARSIGMVFQNYALFPHLSARENVAFGLRVRRMPKSERQDRVEAMLDRVGLSHSERGRRPARLSGGQQQRVALARALVIEPKLLLLDEPMANLDKRLREQMRGEIRELQQRTGVTTVFVTHDQEEALSLATHLGVMMDGRLVQTGTPDALYNRPQQARVARFLGETNLLQVQRSDASHHQLQGGITVPIVAGMNGSTTLMVRPEHIRIAGNANGDAGANPFSGRIRAITFMGADLMLEMELADQTRLLVQSRRNDFSGLRAGETLNLCIDPGGLWPLPEESHSTTAQ